MLNLTETAIRLYRQIFGSPELAGQLGDGIETVLDGNTAIAVTEACISEVAALGGGFMEHGAALAWLSEQQRVSNNLFDEKLSVQQADSSRGALASAMGVTMSGHRSTVFLSAQDLSACLDLLRTAVGRRLPLVIHLDNRLSAMQGNSAGSGHEALHQVMDCGCLVLFAANVQEAVDFSLLARHVAEITLTPALVVVDGIETALAVQDVRLPSAELVQQFIGRADDFIDCPSTAQKQLFSEQRKRIHRWHDLDKPVLQGAMQEPQVFALASAAASSYFEQLIEPTLATAFAHFANLTGRQYSTISTYALKKADIVIVAQGSAIETAKALSNYCSLAKKREDRLKLGVIGLHSLRPFVAEKLLEHLSASQTVVILERMDVPLSDDAPLMREIRSACHYKMEQKNHSSLTRPKLHSVIFGLGGATLNIADLLQLCKAIKQGDFSGRYLGVPFIAADSLKQHPKRQVMLDTLKRYYPQIETLGINAQDKHLPFFSDKSMSFAISYLIGDQDNIAYAMELASYVHKLSGNFLRSFISPSWQQWAKRKTDYISQSDKPFSTGDSSLVDFFIALSADEKTLLSACHTLNNNGILIFTEDTSSDAFVNESLLTDCLQLINNKNITLYKIDVSNDFEFNNDVSVNEYQWEQVLASLMGVLLNNNRVDIKSRKVISIRQSLLTSASKEKQIQLGEIFTHALNASMEKLIPFDSDALISERFIQPKYRKPMTISDVPEMVKNLGQAAETYDSLPRFWDQIGVLYQSDETQLLTADPYLATGTIPSLSATFNNMSQHRLALMGADSGVPVFNAKECTACGLCWSNCPDSAIATVVLNPKALIETGIKITGADALRQVTSKLASRIAKRCRNNEIEAVNTGQLLADAFAWLKEKSALSEERMDNIEVAFEKVYPAIADLPIVTSDLFFYSQEKQQNDSGELFSLIINPDVCKGCGLCVEMCCSRTEEPALSNVNLTEAENANLNYQLRQQWNIWQQTPDTSSATIERVLQEQSMGAGAVLMLSRYNAFALSGGDYAEPASGEKIAMRQLLSATEYHQQPLFHQLITQLEQLRDELIQEINSSLSVALPTANLAQLSEKLSDVKTRQVDLHALLEQTTKVMGNSAIDAVRTHQLVKLVIQLNELHWQLSQGLYGLGRSRYSLCITSSSIASWAGTFPYNPFHVPVNIDVSGESAQVAAGLVHGQINDLLSAVSLLRQARASIDTRYAKETEQLSNLNWHDLTGEEQQLCPPLLLVGGDDLLGTHGFSQVSLLLNSSYPVKVVIFNELDNGLAVDGLHEYQLHHRSDSRNNLAMMAMSQRNAYVAQTSIADNSHFQRSVHELLGNNSAGLLCIHTPSPERHGFKPEYTLRQAELAIKSRMLPLFRYNPQLEGVFGTRLSLDGNVADDDAVSPVIWALNEKRFQAHFSPLPANAFFPVELSDWLTLSASEQNKKTPFVTVSLEQDDVQHGDREQKIALSKEFAAMIVNQQNAWRTLQELAGIITPFTDYVEQCVAQRLSSEHQAELAALRSEYEAKITRINANYENETHTKIRNQLLGLAGYDTNNLRE